MAKRKLNFRGVTALALAAAMMLGGCGKADGLGEKSSVSQKEDKNSAETSENKELQTEKPVELTWYVRFDDQKDTKMVNDALNEILLDKINATVKIMNIPGATYNDKMQVILGGQEECDVIFAGTEFADFWGNISRGAFLPLNDLLKEYAPETYAAIPEEMWKGVAVDGEIYGVINYQIEGKQVGYQAPKDLLEKYNFDLSAVSKVEDIEPLLAEIKKDSPEMIPFAGAFGVVQSLITGYDDIGTFGSPGVVMIGDETLTVVNQFETEEFRDWVNLMRDWFEKGYIASDAATISNYNDLMKAGKVGVFLNDIKPGGRQEQEVLWGREMEEKIIRNARILSSGLSATVQTISTTSKHPEKAMEFINLLNTDKEVYNLLCFGIEGVHYNKVGENRIEMVENSGYQPNKAWAMGNQFNAYVYGTQPDDVWEKTIELNENGEKSPLIGFVFDPSPVKSQVAQCQSVFDQYCRALVYGTVDPEKYLPEFIDKLKQAGSQEVIAEKQKQLNEWVEAQK